MENQNKNKVVSIGCKCDVCRKKKAKYDGKTIYGPWGYMCKDCFERIGYKIEGLYTVLPDD